MDWDRRIAVALVAAASIGLSAQAPALTYNPNHYVNNDPIWDVLNAAQVTANTARGEYVATFPAALRERDNRTLKIAGFILPLEPSSQSAHFMLVRRNTGCPFCPPNAPTEALEVFSQKPVRYTGEEIVMTGRLKLVSASSEGLFFQLQDADVASGRN
jgi:hypothetical protein